MIIISHFFVTDFFFVFSDTYRKMYLNVVLDDKKCDRSQEPFHCLYFPMVFLYYMVAHFTVRTYWVNQAFRFVEGIWLHRKSRQIRFFFSEKDLFYIIHAQREMSNHLI